MAMNPIQPPRVQDVMNKPAERTAQDRLGSHTEGKQTGTNLSGGQKDSNLRGRQDAFRASIAQASDAARAGLGDTQVAGRQEGREGSREERTLAVIAPQEGMTLAPLSEAKTPVPTDRAAAIQALANKISAELDAALRMTTRSAAGGTTVQIALSSPTLGLTGITIVSRGAELTVSLQLSPDLAPGALAAAAQELAATLAQRFPRRTIRIERAEEEAAAAAARVDEPTGEAALSALFKR